MWALNQWVPSTGWPLEVGTVRILPSSRATAPVDRPRIGPIDLLLGNILGMCHSRHLDTHPLIRRTCAD